MVAGDWSIRKMSVFSRLARSARGNAVMLALTMVPVAGAVGAAIDYSRVVEVRSELAEALDGGLLAVSSRANVSDAEALAMVKAWVDTRMAGAAATWTVDSVTQDAGGKITAAASAKVKTTIARILGVVEVPVGVTSQVLRSLAP
jgi:Flp pilus assembly protein TadG